MKKIILLSISLVWFSLLSKSQNVVINEIMYNFGYNLDKLESGNWIELQNLSINPVDLRGWKIQFGVNTYTVTFNKTIPPNGYLVVSSKDSLMMANYPSVPLLGKSLGFGLDDGSETIKVFNGNGALIDEVTYTDTSPWPECADGTGQSLSLINVASNNSLPGSWRCSGKMGGTPGVTNTSACSSVNDIVINEINYKSDTLNNAGDWIELYNPNNAPVDISNWLFLDSDTIYMIQQGTTIAANDYFIIVSERAKFAGMHSSVPLSKITDNSTLISLSGNGEQIALLNNNRCLVDEVNYNDSAPWPTKPDGGGPTLSLINANYNNRVAGSWTSSSLSGALFGTPAQANNIPDPCASNPPNLVINEINFDSDGANNPSNWVEIYNPNATEIDLSRYKINNKGEQYTVPSNTKIAPNDYIVFADSLLQFQFIIECPTTKLHQANTGLNFGNGGDLVSIYSFATTDHGCLIDSVRYNNKAPWPTGVGGSGNTLELKSPNLDNSNPANWASSNYYFGSSGLANQQATETVCPCDAVDVIKTGNLILTDPYTVAPNNDLKITAGECILITDEFNMAPSSNVFLEIKSCQ